MTAYAMLQSAMLDESGSSGTINRIVAFDTRTARPKAQFAYRMEAMLAGPRYLGAGGDQRHRFPRARAQQPRSGRRQRTHACQQKVFRISLAGATDVSDINLVTAPAGSYAAVAKIATPWLDLAAAASDALCRRWAVYRPKSGKA